MMSSLIPNPLFDYMQLFNLLLPVASLFVAAGLLSVFQRAATVHDQLRGLVQVTAVVALLANFDLAVQTAKSCTQTIVKDGLKASPEKVHQKFTAKLLGGEEKSKENLWSRFSNFGKNTFHAILGGIVAFAAVLALACSFLAYLGQELALELGIGFAPILVSFLLLPATRSIGVHFLLYMLAIVLFPLGWGAASLVSDRLIEFATKQDLGTALLVAPGLSIAMRNLFGGLLLAVWIMISTFYAPYTIMRGVTSGVHINADAVRAIKKLIPSPF